jgi:hypothetical protein
MTEAMLRHAALRAILKNKILNVENISSFEKKNRVGTMVQACNPS